jgi:hypothetical protein
MIDPGQAAWIASFVTIWVQQSYSYFKVKQDIAQLAGTKIFSVRNGERIADLHEKLDKISIQVDSLRCANGINQLK